MTTSDQQSAYQALRRQQVRGSGGTRSAEDQLDALLTAKEADRQQNDTASGTRPTPIESLRERIYTDIIPVIRELKGKYESHGITLQSNSEAFADGAREWTFEIGVEDHKLVLRGVATRDMIGFEEIHSRGGGDGQISSGPMLRLRTLDGQALREFLCTRITSLVRSVIRQRR